MIFVLPVLAGTAATLAAGATGLYYAAYGVRSQWFGATDWHGRTDTAGVALTFDDGPTPDTERILDILGDSNIRATFFMLGRQVELYPRTARRIVAEGHEIGNHSYSHPIFLYRSPQETSCQLERAQRVIADITGVRPRLARPPCGVRTPAYFAAARRLNLRTVQWDAAGFDWKKIGASEIARKALRHARAGSIILLHDGDSAGKRDRSETVAALPAIIEGLRALSLRVVPLEELLTSDNQP